MKIDARRVESVLQAPGSFQAILLYGDDIGLIRSRGDVVTRAIAGRLDDPFRVVSLERDSHNFFTEEVTALAMTGGRRVVRVRDAGDALTAPLQAALDTTSPCLIVVEATGLTSKSRLRVLAERHASVAAIGCYPEDGRSLEATIRAVLSEGQVGIEREALAWVLSQLGADQALTQREVEKLALYCGPGGVVDLPAAQSCIGDAAAISLEDALFAATIGDIASTDRALGLAMAEGSAPVSILRQAILHLQRLYRASLVVAGGAAAEEAMRVIRPPLFYRRQTAFLRSLKLWPPEELKTAIEAAFTAEQACKRTGAVTEAICAHTIWGIARRSAQLSRINRA